MTILDRIHADSKERASRYQPSWRGERAVFPPLTLGQIVDAEARVGFAFPCLLRDIYMRVGNGGVCVGPHLMGILYDREWASDDALAQYLDWYDPIDPGRWPRGIFALTEWGCGAWSYVDCLVEPHPVYVHDWGRLAFGVPEPVVAAEVDRFWEEAENEYRDLNAKRDFSCPVWVKQAESLEQWFELWLSTPDFGYDFKFEQPPPPPWNPRE